MKHRWSECDGSNQLALAYRLVLGIASTYLSSYMALAFRAHIPWQII